MKFHLKEYLSEALCLGLFMVSAGVMGTLLEAKDAYLHLAIPDEFIRRGIMGLVMGATAIGLIYSPFGKLSGAHMNPAVTISFLFLRKISFKDAIFYTLFQFLGGLSGVLLVWGLFGNAFKALPVQMVATLPGTQGPAIAFISEYLISFLLFLTILIFNNIESLSQYTGFAAGILVCLYITFEAPLSGMSINPARSFASAAPLHLWQHLWLYFIAPPLGMLTAAQLYKFCFCKNIFHHGMSRRIIKENTPLCSSVILRGENKTHNLIDEQAICATSDSIVNRYRFSFCKNIFYHGGARRNTEENKAHNTSFRNAFKIISLTSLILISNLNLTAQEKISGVNSVRFNVKNIELEKKFFSDVLGFETVNTTPDTAILRLGEEKIELVKNMGNCDKLLPEDTKGNDLWFQHIAIVVSDMDKAYNILRANNVKHVSNTPQTLPAWNKAAADIKAFYFKDPEGHNLELIYFPPGKGNPKWQNKQGKLFLGIDHTAITVSNTAGSIKFYQSLGFKVVGESENYGIEQEHLNNVFGAHLKITALRAKKGIGIEFLEYLTPTTGRTAQNTCTNDPQNVITVLEGSGENTVIKDPDNHELKLKKISKNQQKKTITDVYNKEIQVFLLLALSI